MNCTFYTMDIDDVRGPRGGKRWRARATCVDCGRACVADGKSCAAKMQAIDELRSLRCLKPRGTGPCERLLRAAAEAAANGTSIPLAVAIEFAPDGRLSDAVQEAWNLSMDGHAMALYFAACWSKTQNMASSNPYDSYFLHYKINNPATIETIPDGSGVALLYRGANGAYRQVMGSMTQVAETLREMFPIAPSAPPLQAASCAASPAS